MESETTVSSPSAEADPRAWVGYVVPTIVFLVFTALEGQFSQHYVPLYFLKVILVTACLILYRSTMQDYRPTASVLIPAILVGLFVFLIWIPLDRICPVRLPLGSRTGFDPDDEISNASVRLLFLIVRLYGLVLLVPIMEELFWRSFMLRYISEPHGDFKRLPIGTFTRGAFALVAVLFALAHPEWLSALICAVAYGVLLWRTRSLFAVLIAHSLTNLLLGVQILVTHNWRYW